MASLSVGDIMAIIQLGTKILQILGNTDNAYTELREAVEELGHLNGVLIALADSHLLAPAMPENIARINALRFALSQCHTLLDKFFRKVERYEIRAAKKVGKRELMKRGCQAVIWTFLEKDNLLALKTSFTQHKMMITLMLTWSNR